MSNPLNEQSGEEGMTERAGKLLDLLENSKTRIALTQEAMNIPWLGQKELSQAIPPDYSYFIGRQFI